MEWVGIISAALGGGVLVAVVQAIAQKGKTKVESESVSIKNALDLERVAMDRLRELQDRERAADMEHNKLKDAYNQYKLATQEYISVLHKIMDENGVKYPKEFDLIRGENNVD